MNDNTKQIDVTDKDTLKEMYQNKKLSMQQIADKSGETKAKVRYWLEKNGVERREREVASMIRKNINMHVDHHGYEVFKTQVNGEPKTLQHHRLIAVAHNGISELDGKDVHHKNNIPWDNRPENLEMLTRAEHTKRHNPSTPVYEKLCMWAMHETGEYTYDEIAEIMDENPSNVGTFITNVRHGKFDSVEAQ